VSITVKPVPQGLFAPGRKHAAVFAHQDDETGYLGLMQRIAHHCQAFWVTNGDGLAPFEKADPQEYAALRKKESTDAMEIAGFKPGSLHFLGHSELEIYDDLKAISLVPANARLPRDLRERILGRSRSVIQKLFDVVRDVDVVWTLAFQGGHPEHDLTHFFTWKAVEMARKQGRSVEFFELPEYEIMFFVPLRFPPWKRGEGHLIELTDQELGAKERAMMVYPSQAKIIGAFEKLINLYGVASALALKPFDFKSFASREYFARVPDDRRYNISPHGTSALDYIREYHEGARISFDGTVARWIETIESDLR